ncbi:hypothetical protein F8M41_022889 [Gigaspora margarita]|uniref:Uncharacterized protein n=1 Tax=Gigaspora margarita TaxID=4874 RepID=A0A8H4EHK8_GIGMA|nr:hypothetical protein F8M41_022889 [Gigaspora margarita]
MMFETIEDNKEILKASIKLIWIATDRKVVNIIFDYLMLLAKVVLDNDTSKIIILDEPEAVLLNKNNYRKIKNELMEKSSIAIDEEPTQESRLVEDTMKNKLKPLQNNSSSSDEYSNMEEENNELIFDSLVLLPEKRNKAGQSFVAKIVKNINEKADLSQTSNDLELGEEIEHILES